MRVPSSTTRQVPTATPVLLIELFDREVSLIDVEKTLDVEREFRTPPPTFFSCPPTPPTPPSLTLDGI